MYAATLEGSMTATSDEPDDDLIAVCREELALLWDDLNRAVRDAMNGSWSIQCDNLQHRIERLTKLVGPTPWESIQIPLLLSGVYQRIHEGIGVDAPVDMDRANAAWASIQERRRKAMQRD